MAFETTKRRDELKLLDPMMCAHDNATNLKNTADEVTWYCRDCNSIVDARPRHEHIEAEAAAKAIECANTRARDMAVKLSDDLSVTASECWQMLQLFGKKAEQRGRDAGDREVMASEFHKIMSDCVDAMRLQKPCCCSALSSA